MYSFMQITSSLQYIIHPFLMIILCLLSVFVVLGNLLVVSAIWHENQLHSVTNYLIASLAAADCLVGAVVMPFSVISEIIIGSWTFGALWCDLWHSFDVLASTASIMNLCAISLDRYLAITNPISYPTKMTPKRVALLIVSLWTCSSLISFPAILWWRAVGDGSLQEFSPTTTTTTNTAIATALETNQPNTLISTSLNHYTISNDNNDSNKSTQSEDQVISSHHHEQSEVRPQQQQQQQLVVHSSTYYQCVFTDNTYYLLFSSFISFYGPLCIMLYAYYQIYVAAVQQTRFLKHGSKQIMMSSGRSGKRAKQSRYISECINGVDLVLRAHRGGGGAVSGSSSNSSMKINNKLHAPQTHSPPHHQTLSEQHKETGISGSFERHTISINRSCPTINEDSENFNCDELEVATGGNVAIATNTPSTGNGPSGPSSNVNNNATKTQMLYYDSGKLVQSIVDLTAIHYIDSECVSSSTTINTTNNNNNLKCDEKLNLDIEQAAQQQLLLSENNSIAPNAQPPPLGSLTAPLTTMTTTTTAPASTSSLVVAANSSSNIPPHRQHKSVAKKLSKLAKERKAAKTLGIVVGVFILCWLPFFVVNIIVALCGANCISNFQVIMSIVTWLGWLNSAMNPVIYACWSRDFRRAFRRVLCSWVEFICPYDGSRLARKLKLKKSSNYSSQETSHLNRNFSSVKGGGYSAGGGTTSSVTIRSGVSSLADGSGLGGGGGTGVNGGSVSLGCASSAATTTTIAGDHATACISSSLNSASSCGVYNNSSDVTTMCAEGATTTAPPSSTAPFQSPQINKSSRACEKKGERC